MKFYVVAVNTRTHEEWEEGSFGSIKEACEHARYCWDHLTKYEQKFQQIDVRQYAGAVQNDVDHNYLTINRGFDGKAYLWYADETTDVAICVEDGRIVDGTEGLLWWE